MESRTGFLISQIKQVQARIFQRLLQESGVEEFNGPQGRILYVLWQKDEVPIVELSQKTGLAKNTLTAMLGIDISDWQSPRSSREIRRSIAEDERGVL